MLHLLQLRCNAHCSGAVADAALFTRLFYFVVVKGDTSIADMLFPQSVCNCWSLTSDWKSILLFSDGWRVKVQWNVLPFLLHGMFPSPMYVTLFARVT